MIVTGYEDANDADRLRHDPAFQILADQPLGQALDAQLPSVAGKMRPRRERSSAVRTPRSMPLCALRIFEPHTGCLLAARLRFGTAYSHARIVPLLFHILRRLLAEFPDVTPSCTPSRTPGPGGQASTTNL